MVERSLFSIGSQPRRAVAAIAALSALGALGGLPKPPPAPDAPVKKEVDTRAGAVVLAPPIDGMVLVPAGKFLMGADDAAREKALVLCQSEVLGPQCKGAWFLHEGAPHVVRLHAFWIDRTEVTVGAYRRCVELRECAIATFPSGDARFDAPDLPVTHVAWDDARRFCGWRGGRLPTEAEWERAARGLLGRTWPWGMLPNDRLANHGALEVGSVIGKDFVMGVADPRDGFAGLAPVGRFVDGATPDGIHDLAGNVAEWVADYYHGPYLPNEVTDPTGPETAPNSFRVVRGGSYRQPLPLIRSTARTYRLGSTRDPDLGFRCARDASS